jgi:hypothetical protein
VNDEAAMRVLRLVLVLIMAAHSPAVAGGLLGDGIEGLCGNCGLGEALDDAHRGIKEAVPPYKGIEEGGSRVLREGGVETAGPALCAAIIASRNDAISAGTRDIPDNIFDELRAHFGTRFLNGIKYRIGQGHEISLQANSFRFGDARAITLDHVIVFKSRSDIDDLWLWAHELGHIRQVERSGLMDFCKRYVRSYRTMEREADQIADAFLRSRQVAEIPWSGRCQTDYGVCRTRRGPVGSRCICIARDGTRDPGERF